MVSIRSMLVEPGRSDGTSVVTTTVSPRHAMRWARVMSRAIEQISSTCASYSLITEYTPQATINRHAVRRFRVRLRIDALGRSRTACRVELSDPM